MFAIMCVRVRCAYGCVSVCFHIHIHICPSVYVCLFACICLCVWMSVCPFACVCLYVVCSVIMGSGGFLPDNGEF